MNITCPHCNFTKSVDADKVPDRPVKVTCPQCKAGFSFDKTARPAASEEPAPSEITCPACGHVQPRAKECRDCGVVFARLQARQRAQDRPGASAGGDQSLAAIRQDEQILTAQTRPKAGFWIRVVASLIDGFLLFIVQLVFGLLIGFTAGASGLGNEEGQLALGLITQLMSIALSLSYAIFFLGYCGQTPGKMAVRVKVIRTDGTPISYGRAFLREAIGKFISGILLGIGYLMVAFDSQKQGLHDKIADTYVIKL